jgi:hypothetical protein
MNCCVVVQLILSVREVVIHHRDTEGTEDAQRLECFSLCPLCALCVSVVNASFILTQDQTEPPPTVDTTIIVDIY